MKYLVTIFITVILASAVSLSLSDLHVTNENSIKFSTHFSDTPQDVNFEELIDNIDKYVGKTVRFRAIMFESGFGLYRPPKALGLIHYDFDLNAGEAWSKVRKIFEDDTFYIPHQSGPCLRARATVVGKVIVDSEKTEFVQFTPDSQNKGKFIGKLVKDEIKLKRITSNYWVIIQKIDNVESCPSININKPVK